MKEISWRDKYLAITCHKIYLHGGTLCRALAEFVVRSVRYITFIIKNSNKCNIQEMAQCNNIFSEREGAEE